MQHDGPVPDAADCRARSVRLNSKYTIRRMFFFKGSRTPYSSERDAEDQLRDATNDNGAMARASQTNEQAELSTTARGRRRSRRRQESERRDVRFRSRRPVPAMTRSCRSRTTRNSRTCGRCGRPSSRKLVKEVEDAEITPARQGRPGNARVRQGAALARGREGSGAKRRH
jgi:hypothetical protein